MQKKIVTTLALCLVLLLGAVGFVACGDGKADPVAGNTYAFEKVEITKGASGDAKKTAEAMMTETYKELSMTVSFTETEFTLSVSGSEMSGTYTQSGSKLTLTIEGQAQTWKVSGDEVSVTQSGKDAGVEMTVKMTYKLVPKTAE